jgi:hypothetical protein
MRKTGFTLRRGAASGAPPDAPPASPVVSTIKAETSPRAMLSASSPGLLLESREALELKLKQMELSLMLTQEL